MPYRIFTSAAIFLIFCLLSTLSLSAQAATAQSSKSSTSTTNNIVTAPGSMNMRNNGSGNWSGNTGFTFTVGKKDVYVSSLGIYDAAGNQKTPDKGEAGDGLETPAIVTIYQVNGKKKIAQATVPAADKGMLKGGYRYVSLSKSVVLKAGEKYAIVIGVSRGGNGFLDYHGSSAAKAPTFSSDFSGFVPVFSTRGNATHAGYPTGSRGGKWHGVAYSGPNFQYHLQDGQVVSASASVKKPEPSKSPAPSKTAAPKKDTSNSDTSASDKPIITAPGEKELRNNGTGDWAGNTGFQFTVGSKNVTVTYLGIYDAPGNEKTPNKGKAGDGLEQPAVVTIYMANANLNNTHPVIAQVTVPAGKKAMLKGEYRYVKMPAPVLLSAKQIYRIAIGVSRGGNGFRNYSGGKQAPAYSSNFTKYKAYFANHGNATHAAYPFATRRGAAYSGPNFLYHITTADETSAIATNTVILQTAQGFEELHGNKLPQRWSVEPHADHGRVFDVTTPGAAQSIHALRLAQDWKLRDQDENASLTYTLPKPAKRVSIQFDMKWTNERTNRPSFAFFTKGPDKSLSSEIKMHISRNVFCQSGGILAGDSYLHFAGDKAGKKGGATHWYRVRLVADSSSSGVDVWISQPDQMTLPKQPTATLPAYGLGQPIASINFGVGKLYENVAWIDNVIVRTGMGLPKPPNVAATPNLSSLSNHYQLWKGKTFPRTFQDIPYPKGLKFHMIFDGQKPWHWCHGASIAWHKDKLYATWAVNKHGENSPGEMVLGAHSSDDGKTWSKPVVVAPGDGQGGKIYSNSHGVMLNHNGKLWGFYQHWKGGWNNPLAIEAFVLNDKTGKWESKGVVARKGWPIDPPQHLANGNWAIGLSGFRMREPAVAISHGDDFLHWDTVKIPEPGHSMFQETSLIAHGNNLHSITRRGRWAWVADSKDGGKTWIPAKESNYPNCANPSSGVLSTGQWFLIGNMQSRDDLEIGVGKPGQQGLSKIYRIRFGSPPAAPYTYKGTVRPRAYAYPSYVEHDGKLYVVYSVAKYDIELAVIPVSSLKAK